MVDMAFAFSRRYRWHSRLVPTIEMPNVTKRFKDAALVYTIAEAVQLYVGFEASTIRFPITWKK